MIETSATEVRVSAARKQTVANDEVAIVAHPHRPRVEIVRQDIPPPEARMRGASAAEPNRLRQNTIAQRLTGASRVKKPAALKATAERTNSSWPLVACRRGSAAVDRASELGIVA